MKLPGYVAFIAKSLLFEIGQAGVDNDSYQLLIQPGRNYWEYWSKANTFAKAIPRRTTAGTGAGT